MAMKSTILVTLFVVVLAATKTAAQLSVINVVGTLFCTLDGNAIANATIPTPVFQNALMQVSCGGNVIASGLTNGAGVFSIVLSPLQAVLSGLLSSCNLVVASPLSNCNSSLPSLGFLQSPLQLVGTVIRGLLSVVTLIPTSFQLLGV